MRVVLLLAALAVAPPALARKAANRESAQSDIIVSARKREERLVDVPVAVTVLSAQAVRDEGIDSVADVLGRTPGGTFSHVGPPITHEIMIRGVGGGRTFNVEAAIGQYRNGAYVSGGNMGGRTFGRMDFFDVERIEVLRGPQGALYGRNAAGGAINIVSAMPQEQPAASLMLAYGQNQRFEGEAIANAPLTDALFLRVGLMLNTQEGGAFTSAKGIPLDGEYQLGARATLRFAPGPQFDARLMMEHFDEEMPGFSLFAYNQLAAPSERFVRRFNTPSELRRHETVVTFHADAELGAARLSSISFFKVREAATQDDMDGWFAVSSSLLANWRRRSTDRFRRFSQELRLSGPSGEPFDWMVGGELMALSDQFRIAVDGATGPARVQNSVTATDSRDRSFALFGALGYALAPRLQFTAEGRFNVDRKRIELESTLFSAAGLQSARQWNLDREFRKFSPVAALTFTPTPRSSLYLRYAEGFRAGGFNPEPDRIAPERFPIAYEPESTTSLELGGKLELPERRLFLAAALYRMWVDRLFAVVSYPVTIDNVTRSVGVVENAGNSRQSGLELEASLRPVDQPSGFGILDISGMASRGWGRILDGPYAGREIPRLRHWQAAATASWQRPVGGGHSIFLLYSFRGEWGGVTTLSGTANDDVELHDLRFGLAGGRWRVAGEIENLTKARFDGDRNLLDPASGRYRQVYTNLPRRFLLRARMGF